MEPNRQVIQAAVDTVIRQRRTLKVMATLDKPVEVPIGFVEKVDAALNIAGWAPYHYTADESHLRERAMNATVPWRFYALDQENILKLAQGLLDKQAVSNPDAMILRMLAAAGAVVLATWLPEPVESSSVRKQERDAEHIAATGAAIQNMLLAATARGIQTYWSSGGQLGEPACFELCQIPAGEKLLGAVFMFPEPPEDAFTKPGKWHDQRGEPEQWKSWRTL